MPGSSSYNFKGLCNFREIGGLPSEEGTVMKKGMIFRSDDLSYASREDKEAIASLRFRTIIDLRTPNERKFKPRILTGSTANIINIPVFFGADLSRQEYIRLIMGYSHKIDLEGMVRDIYRQFAFERTDAVRDILNILAVKNNYPLLIHCTAGKDRTGFISALIHLLCGVPHELVMKEYLETNSFIERRLKKTEMFIRIFSLFRITKAQMRPMFMVRAENLEDVLKKINEDYSGVYNYLKSACGVEEKNLQAIKQILETIDN